MAGRSPEGLLVVLRRVDPTVVPRTVAHMAEQPSAAHTEGRRQAAEPVRVRMWRILGMCSPPLMLVVVVSGENHTARRACSIFCTLSGKIRRRAGRDLR